MSNWHTLAAWSTEVSVEVLRFKIRRFWFLAWNHNTNNLSLAIPYFFMIFACFPRLENSITSQNSQIVKFCLTVTVILVTSLCWWLYDGDWFKMLVAESLCWWLFSLCWWFSQCIKSVTNILNRSPSSQTCHQYIWSPTSVTNIDVTCLSQTVWHSAFTFIQWTFVLITKYIPTNIFHTFFNIKNISLIHGKLVR